MKTRIVTSELRGVIMLAARRVPANSHGARKTVCLVCDRNPKPLTREGCPR
jgi:hypothetical protein